MKYSPEGETLVEMSNYLTPVYIKKLYIIAAEIDDTDIRSETLSKLIDNTIKIFPNEQLYLLLVELLHLLSKRPQEDFLSDLQVLAPIFVRLGGQDAINKIILELDDWEKVYEEI